MKRYGRYHLHTKLVHVLNPIELDEPNHPLYGDPNSAAACGLWPKNVWRTIDTALRPSDRVCPDCLRRPSTE